jgi:hypothetical protein
MTAPSILRRDRRALLRWTLALGCALLVASSAFAALATHGSAFDPWWVATHMETEIWSGPDDKAISFGPVPRGSVFMVIEPQQGARLHVQDQRTGGMAYIDAVAVGPIPAPNRQPAGPPTASPAPSQPAPAPAGGVRTPPAAPQGLQPFWVANWVETVLWSGAEPSAQSLGEVPQFRRFLVMEPQKGDRLKVWSPETDGLGYLDHEDVGPVGPSVWLQPHPFKVTGKVGLTGRSFGSAVHIRNLPVVAEETELRHLPNNSTLTVLEKGTASDGAEWYRVGDGQYIRAQEVRLPKPPPDLHEGRWIDVDLSQPAMITAYEDDKAVYSALAIIGTEATPTLRGEFRVIRRVENETMDSSTVGIPRDAEGGYYLKDVLYTQYITSQGAAIHYNWWLGTFGLPGSHGCLGLNLADSEWFWEWASIGTPVTVR